MNDIFKKEKSFPEFRSNLFVPIYGFIQYTIEYLRYGSGCITTMTLIKLSYSRPP